MLILIYKVSFEFWLCFSYDPNKVSLWQLFVVLDYWVAFGITFMNRHIAILVISMPSIYFNLDIKQVFHFNKYTIYSQSFKINWIMGVTKRKFDV